MTIRTCRMALVAIWRTFRRELLDTPEHRSMLGLLAGFFALLVTVLVLAAIALGRHWWAVPFVIAAMAAFMGIRHLAFKYILNRPWSPKEENA